MKNKRSLLMGSYSIGIAAIAVAVVIALNVFIGQLPTTLTKPDTTPEKLATVGADSKKLLEAVDTEITIYRVYSDTYTYTTENNTQETIPLDVNIVNLLDKYADACSYITLKVIDPVSNPGFLEKYRDEGLTQNSLVFETEKRSVCLSPVDLLRYELDGLPGNYLTYEQCYDYLMSSYYSTGSVPSYSEYFFAENEITGAIDYVTSDSIPVIYTLTGHGETPFDTSFADIIVDENAVQKELSLVTGDTVAVPEDAAAILIYAPY
ncbi:MAG: Gldg family protein, partial [Clostridia bacterium]|nr:Gldg family protein [Clostridia bacterium]